MDTYYFSSLIFSRKSSNFIWGECVLSTTNLINQTLYFQAKYLINCFFRFIPSYSHLNFFYCLCYATNISTSKTKFNTRHHMHCIFFGYPNAQKGYKFYVINTIFFLFLEKSNFMRPFSLWKTYALIF